MRRSSLLKVLALMSMGVMPQSTFADGATVGAEEAVLRVNIAGRQRMLSQRMVKAACLMALDIDTTSAFDQLTQSYDLFVGSSRALRDGDAALGLSPETYTPVLEVQRQADRPWSIYRLVIENGIDNAEITTAELAALDDAALDLLRELNHAVFVTAQSHAAAAPKVSLGLAVTVDVAGRQRMLSQRAVKEACLMQVAAAPEQQAERLYDTIDLFERSLNALREGHPTAGIIAPPNPEVARKLAEVADLWRPIKARLTDAAKTGTLSTQDLGRLAIDVEPLLRTMNEAVGLYGA
ncbi:type IV pili methyl-accepting chemotaxis transducer N-terminal domain-containing protein [Cognatiyoonia sp. IB215182]|uniref:type IV pili methyl-accepting chemotaxis transducer N-terminal domain-containing protein n=1 Tax=Cognatiyoonia sp. IB215182 TaxID=3097353 RepID=UPI002A1613FB|nr:type IV pili methyl-accepting chemotaxis transducer N-terminal domain-containing protein [Cognatiyoonia sp. IB215182]MDX8351959.1 type IV pili methyl-accepting chemotaxis transducer N-terminal domain-containing protein [Cognatiyoonia sp. IB215182]